MLLLASGIFTFDLFHARHAISKNSVKSAVWFRALDKLENIMNGKNYVYKFCHKTFASSWENFSPSCRNLCINTCVHVLSFKTGCTMFSLWMKYSASGETKTFWAFPQAHKQLRQWPKWLHKPKNFYQCFLSQRLWRKKNETVLSEEPKSFV